MPQRPLVGALAAAILAASLLLAPAAGAKDLSGRFGLGGELASTLADSGLSAKFWFSDLGGQIVLGMNWDNPDAGDSVFDVNLGLRVLWSAARTDNTHFYLAGGVMLHVGDDPSQVIDLLIGVEHFLTDYFALSLQVGFGLDIENGISLGLAREAWSASFHFYF